jgi:hypothetical protein
MLLAAPSGPSLIAILSNAELVLLIASLSNGHRDKRQSDPDVQFWLAEGLEKNIPMDVCATSFDCQDFGVARTLPYRRRRVERGPWLAALPPRCI